MKAFDSLEAEVLTRRGTMTSDPEHVYKQSEKTIVDLHDLRKKMMTNEPKVDLKRLQRSGEALMDGRNARDRKDAEKRRLASIDWHKLSGRLANELVKCNNLGLYKCIACHTEWVNISDEYHKKNCPVSDYKKAEGIL